MNVVLLSALLIGASLVAAFIGGVVLGRWLERKPSVGSPNSHQRLVSIEVRMFGRKFDTEMFIGSKQLEQLANGLGKTLVDLPSAAVH